VGNVTTDVVRGVDLGVRAALTGTASGTLWYGLDDSAVGLEASAAGSDPGVESRLRDVAGRLRDGSLNTGA
jgi:hypothetical protein